jgi:fibronectin-binding autotransporter adhesin
MWVPVQKPDSNKKTTLPCTPPKKFYITAKSNHENTKHPKHIMKPKTRFLRSSFLPAHIALSLGLAFVGITSSLHASTLTWDASGTATTAPTDGAGIWDTSAVNWNNGTVDVAWPDTSADIAIFGAANGAADTVTVGTVTANGITFNAPGSGNYTLSTGTITLGAGGINASSLTSGTTTIGSALSLSGGQQRWLVGSGGTLAIDGAVSRTAGATVDFSTTGVTSSTLANVNDILGGWATTGNSVSSSSTGDWATISGGIIATYSAYTNVSGNQDGSGASTQNWKTSDNTTLTASATINSLVQTRDFSVPDDGALTLGSGGLILQGISRWMTTSGSGDSINPHNAKLNSGLASGELFIHVPDAAGDADNWCIWPNIADNGSVPTTLIKDGPGLVRLRNGNTFTGQVIVNGGTLYANGPLYGWWDRSQNEVFSYVSGITINSGATLRTETNCLFGWNGPQAKPITVNAGGTLAGDSGQQVVGLVTLNGGTLTGSTSDVWGSWNFGRASVNQLVATDNSLVTATGMNFYNGASIDVTAGKTLTISGTINDSSNGPSSVIKSGGAGTLVLSGANNYSGPTTINSGTLQIGVGGAAGSLGTGAVTDNGALVFNRSDSYSVASAISGSGSLTISGSGTTTLSGTNTYTGATSVNNGALILSGAGDINSTSGITVGSTTSGKFVQASSVASTPAITLTHGTLDGTGTVGNVTVADSASNILTAGNGGSGTLTTGTLTFDGAATANLALVSGNASTSIAAGALTTNAAGTVTLHVTNGGSGLWAPGTYPLISYTGGSIAGNGFDSFALGAITGLGGRQSVTLVDTGSAVAVQIAGDSPVWSGLQSEAWTTTAIGGDQNWKLLVGLTGTEFQTNDTVLFNDSALGYTNVTINDDTVTPISTVFDNSTLNYTISGNYGIQTGTLTKGGTGTLTIDTVNTYTGGTTVNAGTLTLTRDNNFGTGGVTVNGGTATLSGSNTYTGGTTVNAGTLTMTGNNDFGTGGVTVTGGTATLSGSNTYTGGTTLTAGTLNINNASALGTGSLTINGGTINNTSGAAITLTAGNSQTWNSNLTFGGADNLNLGTGGVTLAANRTVTTNGTGVITMGGAISGGYGITKAGTGTLDLSGTNTYTGNTTVNAGTLSVSGSVTSTGTTTVGNAAGNAVLVVNNGSSLSQSNVNVGAASGAVGAIYQNGGTVTATAAGAGNDFQIGSAAGAYGYYYAGGGTLTANEMGVAGEDSTGNGIMEINGSTVNDAGWFVMARTGSAQTGVLNVYSGSLSFGGGGLICNWGSGQTSIINILGGSITSSTGVGFVNWGDAGDTGIVNLNDGGLLSTSAVGGWGWWWDGSQRGRLNFNGGTLQASGGLSLAVTTANIYSGGATIDNNSHDITIGQPLLAPAGNGITSASVTDGGAGYIAPPIITITKAEGDTTGIGATAIAQIDLLTGAVTGVTITCPGENYTLTPVFALTGGGASTPAVITGGDLVANTSGGLTATGTGTLTLSGTNTYTGGTTINAGSKVAITNDAAFGAIPTSATVNITLNGGTINKGNATVALDANRTVLLGADGGYLSPGWGQDLRVNGLITGSGGLGINWEGGSVTLGAANDYQGDTTIGVAGPGYYNSVYANITLKLGAENALPYSASASTSPGNVVFGTSASSNTATLDLNGYNAQINGLTGESNAIIDNTSGTYATLTLGDNNQDGTFSGVIKNTGALLALNKIGTGTLTLSGASTFGGGTTLSDGTLVIGVDSVVSVGPPLTITSSAVGTGTLKLVGGLLTNVTDKTLYNPIHTETDATGTVQADGSTNITLAGPIDGGGTLVLAGVTLSGNNESFAGSADVTGNVRITSSAGSALASWYVEDFFGLQLNEKTTSSYNLGSLDSGIDGTIGASVSNAHLTLSIGALGYDSVFAGAITDNVGGASGSTVGVTKVGTGTQTLEGVSNTYTGNTTVERGVLSLASPFLADTSTVSIASGAALDLPYTGTDTVGTLILGGVPQQIGTYDSTNSGGLITGNGSIQVLTSPLSGYALWASNNHLAGQSAGEDYNNDGVKNGVAYFMGADGTSFTANPGVVDVAGVKTVTWPMSATFSGTYHVQTSTDLVIWANVTDGVSTATTGYLIYTLPTSSDKIFVRLEVTPAP